MRTFKILLLEDDTTMSAEVSRFLINNGFACDSFKEGSAVLKLNLADYQLFILDINVPVIDGMQVCRKIREVSRDVPVLMLTAYGAVADKVKAFNLGADDYLVKPFYFEELLARVQALLRRYPKDESEEETVLKVDDLEIHPAEKTVYRSGKKIDLTHKEYNLLELLVSSKGRTLSKQFIASKVWDVNFETGTNTIEVYINFLRSKIDKGFPVKLIHTRPGFGYFLKNLDS